jgi:5-deoxy-D-glucuronate isomerase
VSLDKPHNHSAFARAVVIVPSGARVLRDGDNRVCVMAAPCTGGNETHCVSAESSIVETVGSVREESEAEHHLCVEKAHGSLRSYSTEVLGPCVGFPLRRGTNED